MASILPLLISQGLKLLQGLNRPAPRRPNPSTLAMMAAMNNRGMPLAAAPGYNGASLSMPLGTADKKELDKNTMMMIGAGLVAVYLITSNNRKR